MNIDVEKELERVGKKNEEVASQFNLLAKHRQVLVNESLRLEGETRLLERWSRVERAAIKEKEHADRKT